MKERGMNPEAGAEGTEDTGAEGGEGTGAEGGEQGGEQEEPTPYEKALGVEREARKALEAELKKMQAERDAEKEAARLAAMDDSARSVEEAKTAVRAEVAAEYEAKLMGLRAQARAVNFHDAELAVSLAGLTGDMSDDEIDSALAALAKDKPYLVKTGGGVPPAPQGPRSGGAPAADPNEWLRQSVAARNG